MGGFFGIVSKSDCVQEVFFGTDYHSHLGTKNAGMASYDRTEGLQREIHSIANSPFRTKFENICREMTGTSAIGVISDYFPQPLIIRSDLGVYAISVTGVINNKDELISQYLSFSNGHFNAMTGGWINDTELVSVLIDQKSSFTEGIRFAQETIKGTASILILQDNGKIIAARDRVGRLPVLIGKRDDGFAVAFESFAYRKLGYEDYKELGPAEIVEIGADEVRVLSGPGKKMQVCAFLWSYYGYPTSTYEGVNVEVMRCRNGGIMAENDRENGKDAGIDYVCGVPDSGTPHAIGYANESHIPFARPYIKYTPTWSRSFMPSDQSDRNRIANMKQIPVYELIRGKNLLFVDDSIVRGTQLQETVEFLRNSGANAVHMRSACPPVMYGCKFLNFSRVNKDTELLARRIIEELEGPEGVKHIDEYSDASTERGKRLREKICEKFHFESLEFQTFDGIIRAIGLEPGKLCTYCWNGKES